ncbi:hypothetical protein, partial [Alistipes finegoldii]|uniref:hypothetical protein n=1 Tax=Alistipes finegoldii TaxID=214856 RepID=UPI0024313014
DLRMSRGLGDVYKRQFRNNKLKALQSVIFRNDRPLWSLSVHFETKLKMTNRWIFRSENAGNSGFFFYLRMMQRRFINLKNFNNQ